jgi:tRNA nucleotidyltransferase (CCA-adding enzyme)
MLNALSMHLLKQASRGRLLKELTLAFREEKLLDILKLYRQYKVLEELIDGFQWSQDLELKLEKLKDVVSWHKIEFPNKKLEYGWLYLVILLEKVKGEEFLRDMSAPAWVRELYRTYKEQAKEVIRKLHQAKKPSEAYLTLKGFNEPFYLLLAIEESLRPKVVLYMEKLSKLKVDVSRFAGLKGKELGRAIEKEKLKLMDETFTLT